MASTNDFYGGSVKNRETRPPPPKPTGTATARRTASTNATSRPKSAYQSSRSVSSTRPSGSNPASKAMSSRNSASSSTRTGTMKNRTSLSRARKAPVASLPAGSYYNSSTTNESTKTGVGAANPYASSVPAPAAAASSTAETTDTTDNDTWDDWGSPTAKTTTTTTANPHSSWAEPASSTTSAAATNDWYGSSTNTPIAPSGYTSAGFTNQPSQQQAQQQQQQQIQIQPGVGFHQNNNAQQQHQSFLSGAMDSSAPTMSAMNPGGNMGMTNAVSNAAPSGMPSFSMFMPSSVMQQQSQGTTDTYPSMEDEAPLLDELGINIQNMMLKSKAVVFPFSRFGGDQVDPAVICQEPDLPGPIALMLLLGVEMVLTGKLQFGYIYVYGLFGCIAMTLVVNLICPSGAVSIWTVGSIMGYALLPVNILALIKIFVMNIIHMQTLGNILGGLTVLWSTMASTRLLELGCGLRDQRYLIMYPLLLFYSAFVMMTIL